MAEFVKYDTVKYEALKPHPDNPRRGDIDSIIASVGTFGQVKPIIVATTGVIVAGKHVWDAIGQLGIKAVNVAVFEFVDDAEILAYLLADNRSSDKGGYDDAILLRVLQSVPAVSLEATGYDIDTLEDLTAKLGAVPETPTEPTSAAHAEDPETHAARTAARAKAPTRFEMILLLTEEEHAEVAASIDKLKKAWDMDSVGTVVHEAISSAVIALEADGV